MQRPVRISLLAMAAIAALYFLLWPASPTPVGALNVPRAPALIGIYQPNEALESVGRFGDGDCLGPEDIVVDG